VWRHIYAEYAGYDLEIQLERCLMERALLLPGDNLSANVHAAVPTASCRRFVDPDLSIMKSSNFLQSVKAISGVTPPKKLKYFLHHCFQFSISCTVKPVTAFVFFIWQNFVKQFTNSWIISHWCSSLRQTDRQTVLAALCCSCYSHFVVAQACCLHSLPVAVSLNRMSVKLAGNLNLPFISELQSLLVGVFFHLLLRIQMLFLL
jgi:hypothetical protein